MRVLEFITILMFALGVSTADSELLYIPVGFITVGIMLLRFIERRNRHEDDYHKD